MIPASGNNSNYHKFSPLSSSTSFKVASIFPVNHFVTTPPFYDNLEEYPPLCQFDPLQLGTNECRPKYANICLVFHIYRFLSMVAYMH